MLEKDISASRITRVVLFISVLFVLTSQVPVSAADLVKVKLAELYQIHGTQMFDPLFPAILPISVATCSRPT